MRRRILSTYIKFVGEAFLFLRARTYGFRVTLPAGLIIALVMVSFVDAQPRGEAVFLGLEQYDKVGPKTAGPDKKKDGVFAIKLNPRPGDSEITDIQILTIAGPSGLWRARADDPAAGFIGVALAERPAYIVNRAGAPLSIDPLRSDNLLLFVTDDGNLENEKRIYVIKVFHGDGSSYNIKVSKHKPPTGEAPADDSADYPVRMSAVLKGLSNYDAVGPYSRIEGDDKPDGLFVLTVEGRNRSITAIQIRSEKGMPSVWDTVPGNTNGPIGVALVSDPVRLLNNPNGSVRIEIDKEVDLNLYVADNGSIEGGETQYRISVTFDDGSVSWCPVKRVSSTVQEEDTPEPEAPKEVNFLATWKQYVATDAVGPYPQMEPDRKADALFELSIEIKPKGIIDGIEIQAPPGLDLRWGTPGTTSGAWGIGVAYKHAPRQLLNRADGSVRIPVKGRQHFFLYVADPGELSKIYNRLRVIVYLADGKAFQQYVTSVDTALPGVQPSRRRGPLVKGTMTCTLRGFFRDLVNTSNRPGKDGYLDGTFFLRPRVRNKTLVRVDIKDGMGNVRWSTTGKSPAMFLGISRYPKIYELLNATDGSLSIPLSGARTLYLHAADNGLLSDPNAGLRAVATFSDGTTLSCDVQK
jgi:hypothetical protein